MKKSFKHILSLALAILCIGTGVVFSPTASAATVNNGTDTISLPTLPSYKINEPYYFKDTNGNDLYSLTITGITQINERFKGYKKNPTQLFLIDYTYTNIAKTDGVYLYSNNFEVVDTKGFIGSEYAAYFAIPQFTTSPKKISIGTSCKAQVMFGVDNQSSNVKVQYKDDIFGTPNVAFTLDVNQDMNSI